MECFLKKFKFFVVASSLNICSCLFIYTLKIKLHKYYKKKYIRKNNNKKYRMDYSFEDFGTCDLNPLLVFTIVMINLGVAYLILKSDF